MAAASVFFFSSRRRHTRSLCDWSSDVCSSDLAADETGGLARSIDVLGVVASSNGLHRSFERPDRSDDPSKSQKAHQARQEEGCGVRKENGLTGLFQRSDRLFACRGGGVLHVLNPFVGHLAKAFSNVCQPTVEQRNGLVLRA